MSDPFVLDVRGSGDPSFSFLPRLGEGDYDKLQAFYGLDIDRSYGEQLASTGDLYWRLVGFELKSGPAVFQPQVWKDGKKYVASVGDTANCAVAFHWPDAPGIQTGWEPRYKERAVIGWTEGKGDVGFGYSSASVVSTHEVARGSYAIPDIMLYLDYESYAYSADQVSAQADGGPFWIWVMAGGGKVGSDAATRLSWCDNHLTPNPIFQITQKGGTPPPPPTDAVYLVNIDASGNQTHHIVWQPGAPGQGIAALGLSHEGVVVAHIPWVPGGS